MILFVDVEAVSGDLFERLQQIYGPDACFREDLFREFDTLVLVIGPRWLETVNALDPATHVARLGMAQAFREDARVIPVLMARGRPPSYEALPHDLKPLGEMRPLYLEARMNDPLDRFLTSVEVIMGVLDRFGPGCLEAADREAAVGATDLLVNAADGLRDALTQNRVLRLVDVIEGRTDALDAGLERTIAMFNALNTLQEIMNRVTDWGRCVSAEDTAQLGRAFQDAHTHLRSVNRRFRYPQRQRQSVPQPELPADHVVDATEPSIEDEQRPPAPNPAPARGLSTLALAILTLVTAITVVLAVFNPDGEWGVAFGSTTTPTQTATATATSSPTIIPSATITPVPTSPYTAGQRLMVVSVGGAWMRDQPSAASDTILTTVERGQCVEVVDPAPAWEPGVSQYWLNTRVLSGQPAGWIEESSLAVPEAACTQVAAPTAAPQQPTNVPPTSEPGQRSPESVAPLAEPDEPTLPPVTFVFSPTDEPTFEATAIPTYPGTATNTASPTPTLIPREAALSADFDFRVVESSPCTVSVAFRAGDAAVYLWDLGDNTLSKEAAFTHDYTRPAREVAASERGMTYSVTLRAADDAGNSASATKRVSVVFPADRDVSCGVVFEAAPRITQ